MYGNANPLTLTRIIGGLSKTINIANQVIPIYKQAKPLLNGLSETKNIIKNITSSAFKTIEKENNPKTKDITYTEKSNINMNNLPTFFQ